MVFGLPVVPLENKTNPDPVFVISSNSSDIFFVSLISSKLSAPFSVILIIVFG